MAIINQKVAEKRIEHEANINVPSSYKNKSPTPVRKPRPGIKDPVKLLFQMMYYLSVFIPSIVWAIVSYFFTRRKSIRNNVVMLTGSGRGLGRDLALKFAELDCKVACVDIDETNNAETVRLIKEKYPSAKVIAYRCNIALDDDIKNISKNISNDLGEVDIIVNNAGIVSGAGLTESKLDSNYLNIMLDVNLKSHFMIIGEFLPKMIQRNSGHIVAVASLGGLNGLANCSVYTATKHGVVGLMESLYDELQSIPGNKIQTTCICPYFISTNELYAMHWDLRLPEVSPREVAEATIEAITKNRRIVAVPSSLYFISFITKLLPDCLRNLQRDIFYTRILLPEEGMESLGNRIDEIIEDSVTRNQNSPKQSKEEKSPTS